jgi:hypothetical protein
MSAKEFLAMKKREIFSHIEIDETLRSKQWGIIDIFTLFAASSGECTLRGSKFNSPAFANLL